MTAGVQRRAAYRSALRWSSGVITAVVWFLASTSAGADPVIKPEPWIAIAGVRGSKPPVPFTAAEHPKPGVTLVQQLNGEEVSECTVSWAVVSARLNVGYLTAGHCDRNEGAPVWMYTDDAGARRIPLSPLQNAERGVDDSGHQYDASLFFLSAAQQNAAYGTAIADSVQLRDVLPVSAVRALPVGTPICMNGSRSGLTCGPLISARNDDIEWGGAAVQGDSGAPVFVVNSRGDAMAIGMLQRGPSDTDNFATYLAPVLDRLKVRLIIDGKKGSL